MPHRVALVRNQCFPPHQHYYKMTLFEVQGFIYLPSSLLPSLHGLHLKHKQEFALQKQNMTEIKLET